MSITTDEELEGMKAVSEIVALTLRRMREHAKPGMTAKALDDYGGQLLALYGANSAPYLTYKFPGHTCICIGGEVAHGIPAEHKILEEGDLINIDVSAEKNGFWADNGGSFVLGEDKHGHQKLVEASLEILRAALKMIKTGVRIAHVGRMIHEEARKRGYTVIKNLAGHGVGRSLHEDPHEILNCYNRFNRQRFKKNSVVAIETFISTVSDMAVQKNDGWTLIGNKGGFTAQHEHTIVVTDNDPIILTSANQIFANE